MLKKTPTTPPHGADKDQCLDELEHLRARLLAQQELLIATKKRAVLIVLQGMDASGKDGAIDKVFGALSPRGVAVKAFKKPSDDEAAHDFLWRVHAACPSKGEIMIFNRSHYEDILVPTVHKTLPAKQVEGRYAVINDFERMLMAEGTVVLKFMLHVSQDAQQERQQERQTDPHKRYKFQPTDAAEMALRGNYLTVYDKILKVCNKPAPWTVVPADKNWYKNWLIAKTTVEALEDLGMEWPDLVGK